ncbi:MAG: hypothetical protein CMP11_08500 [Zetaproteobacteria bacterium]|nr:hypothetical protein [Pseudobdellovibrionaceae bacterium]
MMKLHLINLINSSSQKDEKPHPLPPPIEKEDRRREERHNVQEKHMTFRSKEEIFSVNDVSKNGFNAKVSERAFGELKPEDVYLCKIRYLGEQYTFKACVKWKKDKNVGFELTEKDHEINTLFVRLTLPIKIGKSLVEIDYDSSLIRSGTTHRYSGLDHTNIYLSVSERNELQAWIIQLKKRILVWQSNEKIYQTLLADENDLENIDKYFLLKAPNSSSEPTKEHTLLCLDIVEASKISHKESIRASLEYKK